MRYLLAAAFAVMLALPVAAQDFQKGSQAHERGDYATALREWRPLAEQGNTKAQTMLGDMYASGHGVSLDYTRAVGWFRKAAEQGDAEAQNNLGVMYGNGLGMPRDVVVAHMWWSLAVNGGYRAAAIGRDQAAALMTAADVSKSRRLAREWLAKHRK